MNKLLSLLLSLLVVTPCYSTQVEKVISEAQPKTVKVGVVLDNGHEAICSGAFVTKEGLVLTCAHCFEHEGITKVFVKTSDGTVFRGLRAMGNHAMDLALILVDTNGKSVPFFVLGKRPIVGQQVIALGSPLGIQGVASVGWVEKIMKETYAFVIHSAFVNPGNSGGPLVNMKGELVGINEAILLIGKDMLAEGLFVAVDVSTIKTFLYGDK